MSTDLIGGRIRELRERSKLSQDDVAKYLGISRQAYSRTESGSRNIPLREIYELARLFEVPYQDITDIVEQPVDYSLTSLCRNEQMSEDEEFVIKRIQRILELFSAQEALDFRMRGGDKRD